MKRKCYNCSLEKDITEFKKKKSACSGYDYICKVCHNMQRSIQKEKSFGELSEYVRQYKLSNPCKMCGEADPFLLEFHHRDPEGKDGNVSDMVRENGMTLQKLKEEIDKCDLLCANDHRRVHKQWIVTAQKNPPIV
jgi:hypothetical protein